MYFGENRHPHLRRSDDRNEQLAEQNALLKKLLRQQSQEADTPRSQRFRSPPRTKQIAVICAALVLLAALGGLFYWQLAQHAGKASKDPFNPSDRSSVQFPLYYPTKLPDGYKIVGSSVNEPTQGVIVFTVEGPNKEKLYVSEEARPQSFDLGGFYNENRLKQTGVSDGAIAVGVANNGEEVASRANNKVWILCNTKARIPQDQLVAMMRSLTVSY